jgi:hypothetical protein
VGRVDPRHVALEGDLVRVVEEGQQDEHFFAEHMGRLLGRKMPPPRKSGIHAA